VARFVALGRAGNEKLKVGDLDGAEASYRAQVAIYPLNPDPHAALAIVAASRGDKDAAMSHLRDAVVRGFTDLVRIERAEAWTKLRRSFDFWSLQDAMPALLDIERKWSGWGSGRGVLAPRSVPAVRATHDAVERWIEGTAPALGPRYKRLWTRLNDRTAAAHLEAWIAEKPDAPETGNAISWLTSLYAESSGFRWEVIPADLAARLSAVADRALASAAEPSLRPGGLACRALAKNADRDSHGKLVPASAAVIRASLGAIVSDHLDSPFAEVALEGLVRTEIETGRPAAAADWFRKVEAAKATAVLEGARSRLGTLALVAAGLPDFVASDLDGAPVGRDATANRVVVFDFWASWCGPCIEEFKTLRRIADRHGEDVLVLGVNLDRREERSAGDLKAWVASQRVPGRQLSDGLGFESNVVKAFGVTEIPFTVVLGRDGSVLAVGEQGRRLEEAVRRAAAPAPVKTP
jgi:thiol-disulfide isomerase/thioredoxin